LSWGRGYRTQLLYDHEVIYGEDPSSVTPYKLPFNSEDLTENEPNQHSGALRNNRNPTDPFLGNKDVTGTLVVPVEYKSIGMWFYSTFGAPNTSGSVIPYTHTFKIGNTIPSFLLDIGHEDLSLFYKYNGCKVNTFSMSAGGDGEVVANIGIIAAKETKGTSQVAAPGADHTSFLIGRCLNKQAAATEGGNPIAYLTEFSFEINNGLTPAYCIGDAGVKSDLAENLVTVTGTITGLFQDDALLLKGRNQTESSLGLTFTNGVYSLALTFPEIVYNHSKPPTPGPEGLMLSLNFEAYYLNHADATAAKAVLVTTVSSYA